MKMRKNKRCARLFNLYFEREAEAQAALQVVVIYGAEFGCVAVLNIQGQS